MRSPRQHNARRAHANISLLAIVVCFLILSHSTPCALATVVAEHDAAQLARVEAASTQGTSGNSTGAPKTGTSSPTTRPLAGVCTNTSLVAIGDLHGDLYKLQQLLAAAGVVSGSGYHWRTGCRATVVQLGDIADRGLHPHTLYEYAAMLEKEAQAQGGEFAFVLGNHELMNLLGQTHYVNPCLFTDVFQGERGFREAFSPTGAYGKYLLAHPVVIVRRGVVFVHGGLTLPYARLGVAAINDNFRRAFDDPRGNTTSDAVVISSHPYESANSPLWDRSMLSQALTEGYCEPLKQALAALSTAEGYTIHTMVVGHTQMPNGTPRTNLCDGALIAVDVGLSDAMFTVPATDTTPAVAYGFGAMVKLTPTLDDSALSRAEVVAPWGVGGRLVIPKRIARHNGPAAAAWHSAASSRQGNVMQNDLPTPKMPMDDTRETAFSPQRRLDAGQAFPAPVASADEVPYLRYGFGLLGIVLLLLIPCSPAGGYRHRASGPEKSARRPRSAKRVTFNLPTPSC